MPGMNSGLNLSDLAVVAAFKAALVHQGLIALLIFAPGGPGLDHHPGRLPSAAAAGAGTAPEATAPAAAEPAWRRLLRIGFGLLWVFDGILQAQPKMAVGLPSQVIEPIAAASPSWVQHLVNAGGTDLVVSPDAGRRLGGVDPGRHRHLADRRGPRPAVPAGRAGQRRLGPGRVGVRRVLRRHLRPRPDLAVRRARRGADLRGGRRADRAARAGLALPVARAAADGRHRACSCSAWRSCRPGRGGGSGRARSAARWPA